LVVLPLKVEVGYNELAIATRLNLFPGAACSASNSSLTSTVDMRRWRPLPNLVEAFNLQKIQQKLELGFMLGFQFLRMEITNVRALFYKGFDPNS
jgi:hypothetical protein